MIFINLFSYIKSIINALDVYLIALILIGIVFALPKEIGVLEAISTIVFAFIILTVWGTVMKYIGLWNLNIYVADIIWVAPIYLTKLFDWKRPKKFKVLSNYYIDNDKRPSIKRGQKWIVDGLVFDKQLEESGFRSTYICKRLGTEVFLHTEDVIATFGTDVINSVKMKVGS